MDNKMALEEFSEFFWEYISENLVTNRDLENNSDWADELVFSVWRVYKNSETITEAEACKISENMILAYKRYNPIFEIS